MAKYLGLKNDGQFYSISKEDEFIEKYKEKWAETMSTTYFQSEAIDVGHKLRPRLVFWGYLSNASTLSHAVIDDLAQVAVCIELIHKASLLIDDFIDQDTSRHSKPTFYVEHGVERTIIYALNILSKSLELLNNTYFKRNKSNSFYYKSLNDITLTLQDMTLGVLRELDLNTDDLTNTVEIKKIMDLETSSLIKSSLLMGYYLSGKDNDDVELSLKYIGKDLGYIFQVLNDMESFFSKNLDTHKGSKNNDIDRARKNICIPILFSLMSNKDKKAVYNSKTEIDVECVTALMNKYQIKKILFDEIDHVTKNIKERLNTLNTVSRGWTDEFECFIDSVLKVFKSRID